MHGLMAYQDDLQVAPALPWRLTSLTPGDPEIMLILHPEKGRFKVRLYVLSVLQGLSRRP